MAPRKHIADDSFLKRTAVLIFVAILFWLLVVFRLVQVQIANRAKYIKKARSQYIYEAELKSHRGIIYDRSLNPLAVNRKTKSIAVDANRVKKPDQLSFYLAQAFNKKPEYYLKKIEKNKPFFWVSRRVDENVSSYLDTLDIEGLRMIDEARRFYPKQTLAAHVIGFTNVDLKGLSGIELLKDNDLSGNNGLAFFNKDALGGKVIDINHPVKKPHKGKDVILTINNTFQWIVEEELNFAVENLKADAGVVIISNPNTGEILSLAVNPTFDLNEAGKYPAHIRRNRAITDTYEPGSTFKSIIMAAVLEEGLKKPDDIVYCENGEFKIYDRIVKDVTGYGWLSMHKVIKKSSNIGMAKIANEIDKNLIYRYVRDFGFGLQTGVDLPGEVSGELKMPHEWSKYTPIAMAMGYEISVTPIQMVMAYGAIANGGVLYKPKICLGAENSISQELPQVEPEFIRRVISKSTAEKLTRMLEEVVDNGTGKRAFINGLRIGGKTGTAMKYDPALKRYSEDKFVSSFVGFFPVDDPKLLIYVMIDNAREDHLGGKVAAPLFKKILQRILRDIDLGIHNKDLLKTAELNEMKLIQNMKLRNMRVDAIEDIANHLGLELIKKGEGEIVADYRLISANTKNSKSQLIVELKRIKNATQDEYTIVPNVSGLNLREAVALMSSRKLHVVVRGHGKVVKQIPEPGSKIRVGARCVVECEPVVSFTNLIDLSLKN